MSDSQKDFIKDKGVSISTLAILIGFIVYQAKFQERTETNIQDFKNHQTEFKEFVTKVENNYMPRAEAEKDSKNIISILTEIKDDLNYLKRNR